MMDTTTSMTEVDFVEGILTVAAERECATFGIADTRFDEAMKDAYEQLIEIAADYDLDVEFQVRPHPIHGDSTVLRGAVNAAVGDRRARRRNPAFRFVDVAKVHVDSDGADQFLGRLPGGRPLYDRLAETFLSSYLAVLPTA